MRDRSINRPVCAVCHFTGIHRSADITLADYWGIEKYALALYNEKGVSLVLANTERGQALLATARKDLNFWERPLAEALAEQPRLSRAMRFRDSREAFWQDYHEQGLKYTMQKWLAALDRIP